jgi:hypothetical protein
MKASGQLHTLATLPFRERAPSTYYTVWTRAGLVMVVKRKVPAITKNWTPYIQTVASHFTDWAVITNDVSNSYQ